MNDSITIDMQVSEGILSRCLTDAVTGNLLRDDVNFYEAKTCHESDKA